MDELGTRTTKVLTAEVMGRHSNLIFWDKETEKIIGASHIVTAEMSRQREVAPTLKYVRPPQQDKPNVFDMQQERFNQVFAQIGSPSPGSAAETNPPISLEQWFLSTFAGMGRHLVDEIVSAADVRSELPPANDTETRDRLWAKIAAMQGCTNYRAAMRTDLTRYTVLSWWPELQASTAETQEWQSFPAVNDMVESYFRTLQVREQIQQLKDRIRSELKSETEKLDNRLAAAMKQLDNTGDLAELKKFGDLVLVNASSLEPGQTELICDDLYAAENGGAKVKIPLNPNLSAAQNAQHYYRQFAKGRVRTQAASVAQSDAAEKMAVIKGHLAALETAEGEELTRLKEIVLDRGKRLDATKTLHQQSSKIQQKQMGGGGPQAGQRSPRLMNTKSTDGWLIYIGRNRNENDVLLSKIAQPHDIWLHVQGQEGAHVLIKNPNKQDPPQTTLKEAAQLAARFSRISLGSKVRVIYTHVKYVRKLGKDKPGMVRYENEKSIEVDTAAPMPASLRRLFSK
jgi:predicted ribosome quality control (RQC) complex YloA/Tae2 family protein